MLVWESKLVVENLGLVFMRKYLWEKVGELFFIESLCCIVRLDI